LFREVHYVSEEEQESSQISACRPENK